MRDGKWYRTCCTARVTMHHVEFALADNKLIFSPTVEIAALKIKVVIMGVFRPHNYLCLCSLKSGQLAFFAFFNDKIVKAC